MPRRPFPDYSVRIAYLSGFLAAAFLLLTGTWQFAYLAGFLVGILSARMGRAALLGALSVSTAWAAYLGYVFALGSGFQLAGLVGEIFGLGSGAWWLLTVLTILLGLLLGAAGGMTGYAGSRLFLWEPPGTSPDAPKS